MKIVTTIKPGPSFVSLLLLLAIFISGCAKDEKDPIEPPPSGGNTSFGEFKWTPSSGTEIRSDSAYYIPSFNNIVAYKGNSTIDIVLSSLVAGTYTISSSQGNTLEYYTGSAVYNATSGSVVITTNTGSRLSGTFNAGFQGQPSINGQFNNIPVR